MFDLLRKKPENNFFMRAALLCANIFQIFFSTGSSKIFAAAYLGVCSTGPLTFYILQQACLNSNWFLTAAVMGFNWYPNISKQFPALLFSKCTGGWLWLLVWQMIIMCLCFREMQLTLHSIVSHESFDWTSRRSQAALLENMAVVVKEMTSVDQVTSDKSSSVQKHGQSVQPDKKA